MRVSNVLKLILRLTVITATMICQLNGTQSLRSCVVTKNNTSNGEIEFQGETLEFCYLHIITPSSAIIALEVPSATSFPFYLYVAREDAADCSNGSYAVINGQAESCYAVFTTFTQNRLQINLRGNISVNLKEIHATDQSIPAYSRCTETGHDFTESLFVSLKEKCKLKWYKQVISCDEDIVKYCRLSFPNKCKASLGYREVELKCVENEEENRKVFLVYPDIKLLDLSGNNILTVDSHTFRGLSSLKGVKLNKNRLRELPIGVFDNLDELFTLSLSFNQLNSVDKGMLANQKQLFELFFLWKSDKDNRNRELSKLSKVDLFEFYLQYVDLIAH